ncbi:MAG: hypothetical protein JXR76_07115 [Deltaproteobacteria bacterium]|nr:hypothetical protein [Deltaproteobacteria bacterium]
MSFKEKWQHAFGLAPDDEPQVDGLPEVLERFANGVVARGMETPAILFLEMVKPLNYIGSQLAYGLSPVAGVFGSAREMEEVARALEHRGAIGCVIERIEQLAQQR